MPFLTRKRCRVDAGVSSGEGGPHDADQLTYAADEIAEECATAARQDATSTLFGDRPTEIYVIKAPPSTAIVPPRPTVISAANMLNAAALFEHVGFR